MSVSSLTLQPQGLCRPTLLSPSNGKPHWVALYGKLENGEGMAKFAYIIIISKTQSASQTNKKAVQLPFLPHICAIN
jgi:hypothetical protein